jgi:branched-chain amino acid transport system permease protein
MDTFIQQIINGLVLGSVYALVALGYTMVYGIINLINFAHGEVLMVGALTSWTVVTQLRGTMPDWLLLIVSLLAAIVVCALLNFTIEKVAYRPLRNSPKLAPLITAIGMSFLLQNVGAAIWGFTERPLTATGASIFPANTLFSVGGFPYRAKSLIVVLITIPVLLLLNYLVRNTKAGKAMRAVAQDMDASRMMGINVDRTIAFTFALGGALAGAAGLLFVMFQTSTRFDLGFQIGLFAFTAAVLGGIGNLTGAVLGAMLIGLIQAFNEGLSWHTPG